MRDLRNYKTQTNRRLLIGFVLLLFIVGDGLIYWIYGYQAAIMGAVCLSIFVVPAMIIWGILSAMEFLVKKVRSEEE